MKNFRRAGCEKEKVKKERKKKLGRGQMENGKKNPSRVGSFTPSLTHPAAPGQSLVAVTQYVSGSAYVSY